MKKLAVMSFVCTSILVSAITPASAQALNCATTPDMPTCACTQLGATKMSNDHSNIVACMLTTPNTTATTCAAGGGCAWKATTSSGGGIGKCYSIRVDNEGVATLTNTPGPAVSSIVTAGTANNASGPITTVVPATASYTYGICKTGYSLTSCTAAGSTTGSHWNTYVGPINNGCYKYSGEGQGSFDIICCGSN